MEFYIHHSHITDGYNTLLPLPVNGARVSFAKETYTWL